MREVSHFIGGKQVAGTSGRFGDIYNPNTGEVQARVALATDAEVAAAVENAKSAFPAWAATNPQRRARVMYEFKRLLEANMDELAGCCQFNANPSPAAYGLGAFIQPEACAIRRARRFSSI